MHDNFVDLNKVFKEKALIIARNKAKKWLGKMAINLKQDVEKKKWKYFEEKYRKPGGVTNLKYEELKMLGTVNRARWT